MSDEHDAEHLPSFTLMPVGSCIHRYPALHRRVIIGQVGFEDHSRSAGHSRNPCEHLQARLSACVAVLHSLQFASRRTMDDAVLFRVHIAAERRRQPVYDRQKVKPDAFQLVSGGLACCAPSFSRHSHPEIAVGLDMAAEQRLAEGPAERRKRGNRACGQSRKIGLRGFFSRGFGYVCGICHE